MSTQRPLSDLVFVDVPAWPMLTEAMRISTIDSRVLPASQDAKNAALESLQVTVASGLGAMVYNCGAILVDYGWLKILGAGADGLPPAAITRFLNPAGSAPIEGVLVAVDVLGGCFLVHGLGIQEVERGEVLYWSPDSLTWSATGLGYSAFFGFAQSERLEPFYADLRWEGWQSDVRALSPDSGFLAYPPPWTVEGRTSQHVHRAVVPIAEVMQFGFDSARQIDGAADGTKMRLKRSYE